jgi:hypothetical protein
MKNELGVEDYTWNKDNYICPYCGYEDDCSYELNIPEDNSEIIECGGCGREIEVVCHVTYHYESKPFDYVRWHEVETLRLRNEMRTIEAWRRLEHYSSRKEVE